MIIVIAAPVVSISSATNTPRPLIAWQSSGQQAFQVQAGNFSSGTIFGTVRNYQVPVFLPNGQTIIRVRVINEFGIWSEWTQRTINIVNSPGTTFNLAAVAGRDAEISWGAVSNAVEYLIYRDGEMIGRTMETEYTDQLAIGVHKYFVRAIYAESDYYTDSNAVTLTLKTDSPIICVIGGEWINLRLSPDQARTTQISTNKDITMLRLSNAIYPVPEASEFMQRSYSISTAFLSAAEKAAFENLIGKIVCVKDQFNNLVIGMISTYTRVDSQFFTAYTAAVDEVDRGEYHADYRL